ncbi:MAG: transglutaminase domain-containing protein [Lachnospiraceae bacterium]|nr:transglutaminase domain-containing protein [Lachnospiraceae bacterium]
MFSEEYYSEIKEAYESRMALLDERGWELEAQVSQRPQERIPILCGHLLAEKKAEILRTMEQCGKEEREALTFLYSAMPLSDLLDYPAALFLAYARHGVFLWNQGDFAGRVPERLFANYVLHYRVNNEDIAETRGFFYDRLKGNIAVGDMYHTAVEVNYWCAREATYRSTDGRTQNPRTMYGTAIGRCGEESTFAVTALRSIGIPARQVYAPLWTHCDDNHAWVEAWCDGEWHFLGACEPEEKLDRGWFTGPASRALLLHSRWFGRQKPEETMVGKRGMATVLNHMERYARTVWLTVKAVDEAGNPVPHARVDFQVLNHGGFGSIAVVHTGEKDVDCGSVRFLTGCGDLYISVSAPGLYGETMANLQNMAADGDAGEEAVCTVTLKSQPECWEGWKDLDINAPQAGHEPQAGHMHDGELTPEQQSTGERRLAQAAEHRQVKAAGFYDQREADRVLGRFAESDREALSAILHSAHSNIGEIVRFLEWDASGLVPAGWEAGAAEHWKVEVLQALREKDCWDIRVEVLIDCCQNALPYAGSMPDEIFFRFLVCPRVFNEMLRPCRKFLYESLGEAGREEIRRNPESLPGKVDGWIREAPEQEYEGLTASAQGCLRGGFGSRESREVLCVNIYRSLGIPARLGGLRKRVEYYRNGKFVSAAEAEKETCRLTLCEEGNLKLSDWEHYSVEYFDGTGFRRLWFWEKMFRRPQQTGELTLDVWPGIYRIVTTNRKASGDQLAKVAVFALKDGEERRLSLSMRDVSMEGTLTGSKIGDFTLQPVKDSKTGPVPLSELAGEAMALFIWLEVTREPTEHILNELFERKEDFAAITAPLYVVLRRQEDLENATLRRTMEALPALRPLLDDFGENYEALAESVGQKVGKLPLALVIDGGHTCIYSDAGYNVGLADMLWKILSRK